MSLSCPNPNDSVEPPDAHGGRPIRHGPVAKLAMVVVAPGPHGAVLGQGQAMGRSIRHTEHMLQIPDPDRQAALERRIFQGGILQPEYKMRSPLPCRAVPADRDAVKRSRGGLADPNQTTHPDRSQLIPPGPVSQLSVAVIPPGPQRAVAFQGQHMMPPGHNHRDHRGRIDRIIRHQVLPRAAGQDEACSQQEPTG